MAWGIWIPCFVFAIWRARWRRLADSEQLNVWLGMVVLLTVIWSLRAGVRPGLAFHLLGTTVFTLSFGPALAFIGLSLVTAAVAFNDGSGPLAFAINACLLAGGGVMLSHFLFRLLSALLPRHFFVYIFVNGFLGAALTTLGIGGLSCVLFGLAGAYSWEYLTEEYFPYFFLLAFAEAWLSGMVMTLFVVYRPAWVASFDDSTYLCGK